MSDSKLSSGPKKGKRGELLVIGELLRRGHQVYLPVVDLGVDCLVDVGGGNYKEIQVKYREDDAVFKARKFTPRESLYFACMLSTRRGEDTWVIPSRIFLARSRQVQERGREYSVLTIGKEGSESYDELARYRNFSSLLAGASNDIKKKIQQVSRKVDGKHFKQPDFERRILEMLSQAKGPMSAKEIVSEMGVRMRDEFSDADLEPGKGGRIRWENTARFAIYQGLKKKGLIEDQGKNRIVITAKGLRTLSSQPQ